MPQRHGGARFFPPRRTVLMKKLPPTVQRLILAFTTGLFLACAAHVSAQGDTIPLSSIEP
jgi:TRAP-type C4-dicarboxylate transport system permease small subunit